MRRPVNYARAIETIERTTAQTTDAWTRLEVQGEIVATGVVVPSLGMRGERPTGRRLKLAEQHQIRSAETSLDNNSRDPHDGTAVGALPSTRAWCPSSRS